MPTELEIMAKKYRQMKSEYEYLRRKKNKQIDDLELSAAKANHDWCDYCTERGLIEDYLKWKGERNGKTN